MRTVSKGNCVRFEGLSPQIPADRYRRQYGKTKVRLHRYPNGSLALFHSPTRPASYTLEGLHFEPLDQTAAKPDPHHPKSGQFYWLLASTISLQPHDSRNSRMADAKPPGIGDNAAA